VGAAACPAGRTSWDIWPLHPPVLSEALASSLAPDARLLQLPWTPLHPAQPPTAHALSRTGVAPPWLWCLATSLIGQKRNDDDDENSWLLPAIKPSRFYEYKHEPVFGKSSHKRYSFLLSAYASIGRNEIRRTKEDDEWIIAYERDLRNAYFWKIPPTPPIDTSTEALSKGEPKFKRAYERYKTLNDKRYSRDIYRKLKFYQQEWLLLYEKEL